MDQFKSKVAPAEGKLAVLLPGMGAVATTFIAGVEAVKAGLGKPIGSLTQMAEIRLGKRSEKRWAEIHDPVPLAQLGDPVVGGGGAGPARARARRAAAKGNALLNSAVARLVRQERGQAARGHERQEGQQARAGQRADA